MAAMVNMADYFARKNQSVNYHLDELSDSVPVTLDDGEQLTIEVRGGDSPVFEYPISFAELYAYDAEGRLYKSNKARYYDEDVGHYYED